MHSITRYLNLYIFLLTNRNKEKHICPICKWHGPFLDLVRTTGTRKHAKCPNCGSLERHRLQKLVLDTLSTKYDFSKMTILHLAPEPFFQKYFKINFEAYFSADLSMQQVDLKADLRELPFRNAMYNIVYASHVLEHIKEDLEALSEIRRVLKPNGMAILPVPVGPGKTAEFREPNSSEFDHVRLPGDDYYDRYQKYFSKIESYSSTDFPEIYQTLVHRQKKLYIDTVPVCYA